MGCQTAAAAATAVGPDSAAVGVLLLVQAPGTAGLQQEAASMQPQHKEHKKRPQAVLAMVSASQRPLLALAQPITSCDGSHLGSGC
jgi:hypothetical protein